MALKEAMVAIFYTSSAPLVAPAGHWSGVVRHTSDVGEDQMNPIDVWIEIAGDQLRFHESLFDRSSNYSIRGSDLVVQGVVVGSLTAYGFKVKVLRENLDHSMCTQTYEFDCEGNYIDDYSCNNGFFDHVEGVLMPEEADFSVKL